VVAGAVGGVNHRRVLVIGAVFLLEETPDEVVQVLPVLLVLLDLLFGHASLLPPTVPA